VPPAGQDGSLPAPVAAALAHLGQAVAAAIGEARAANIVTYADNTVSRDGTRDISTAIFALIGELYGRGETEIAGKLQAQVSRLDAVADRDDNTVTRQEHEDMVRQRNTAMTALMHAAHYILDPAVRAEWAELGGEVVTTAILLHDQAEREVQSDSPPPVAGRVDRSDNAAIDNTVTSDTVTEERAVAVLTGDEREADIESKIRAKLRELKGDTKRWPAEKRIVDALEDNLPMWRIDKISLAHYVKHVVRKAIAAEKAAETRARNAAAKAAAKAQS